MTALPPLALGAWGGIAERADAAELPWPIQSMRLDNGLTVYVVETPTTEEDPALRVAAVATWMQVGSRDEVEPGRTGFAHFFEHLMFHGTPTLPGDERDEALLRLGIVDNAWTWRDETVYHATIPAASLGELLKIEADRFQHLSLTPAGVAREAGAVYGEFRRSQADPGGVLEERLSATAFGTHPYGHRTIGLEADIAAMPQAYDHALRFFAQHYRPDRAALLVVGEVEADEVFALAKETYGAWQPAEAPAPAPIPAEPPQRGPRRDHVDWPTATTPRIALGWREERAEGSTWGDDRAAALELAADLLLAPTGPLHQRLVVDSGLAYDVSGGRDDTVDPGLVVVTVEAREADDLPEIEAAVKEEVAHLAAGVDAAQLDALRTHLRQSFRSSLDDPATIVHVVGSALRRDPDPAALERYRTALAEATPKQVAAAAATLVDDRLTVVTLTPPGAAE
ncbi:MAG: pitrilysin family protein [Myxococcota bacterium]